MKYIILLLIGLLSFPVSAQINVNIIFKTDKVDDVEVWVYDNFIVGSTSLAFTANRVSTKHSITSDHTGKMIVKTGVQENSFYIQPSYTYNIFINEKSITLQSTDSTNELMQHVEYLYKDTWKKNVSWPNGNYKKSYLPAMKELLTKLNSISSKNKYFDKLLRYKMAAIKLNIAINSVDNTLFKEIESVHLSRPKVDYWNPLYISLVGEFYIWKNTFLPFRNTPNISNSEYKSFFNELALSQNDTVKQIATLHFIKEAARSYWGKDQAYTNHLLDSLKENAVNNTLKESIAYTYKQLNILKVGDQVKDFTYYNLDEAPVNLSDFKGKWVLLDFWFVGCTWCHKAIPELKQLQSKFDNCLEIVSINPMNSFEKVKNYTEKNNLSWNFYSAKHDSSINSYFNITGYPTYFLIDPNGKFRLIPNDFDLKNISKEISSIIKTECK